MRGGNDEPFTLDKQMQEMLWNELRGQEEVTMNLLGHDVRFILVPGDQSDFTDMVNEIESDPDLRKIMVVE